MYANVYAPRRTYASPVWVSKSNWPDSLAYAYALWPGSRTAWPGRQTDDVAPGGKLHDVHFRRRQLKEQLALLFDGLLTLNDD